MGFASGRLGDCQTEKIVVGSGFGRRGADQGTADAAVLLGNLPEKSVRQLALAWSFV